VPKVTEEHVETRRRQILDGARRGFARHGYEGATVAILEREIGLSRGAIFNYFPSKWDLFYALAQEDFTRGLETWLEDGYGAALRRFAEESDEWLGVYLEVLRKLRTSPELMEAWRHRNPELESRLEAHLRGLQDRGEVRRDLTVDQLGNFLGLVIDGCVLRASVGIGVDVDAVLRLVGSAIGPQ
jgi:AcrR family transcriptional regulator